MKKRCLAFLIAAMIAVSSIPTGMTVLADDCAFSEEKDYKHDSEEALLAGMAIEKKEVEDDKLAGSDQDISYSDSGTCGDNLTWTLSSDGELIIKGNGKISDSAFSGNTSIKKVVIESGVTEIGLMAFGSCSNLVSAELPPSIKTIEGAAFEYCTSLTSITIPESVISIDGSAFAFCDSLTNISVDKNNNNFISQNRIIYTKDMKKLVLCLPSITGTVNIPEGVTSIENDAFYSCNNLNKIVVPSSISNLSPYSFVFCKNLQAINVKEGNPNYTSKNGFVYNNTLTDLIICPRGASGDVVIPNGTINIKDGAFRFCNNITSITFPESVEEIENETSISGSSLTKILVDKNNMKYSSKGGILYNKEGNKLIRCPEGITGKISIPSNVTLINEKAFELCEIRNVKIPSSVTDIGEEAFSFCTYLTDITLPSNITEIKNMTFAWCYSLTSITIPLSVTKIDMNVFWSCPKFTDVYYAGSEEAWKVVTIGRSNDTLKNATIHYNSTPISETQNTFSDVNQKQFFYEAVMWGVENDVVSGYTEPDGSHTFRPDDHCTRAQFVTFLWRTFGSQKPKSTKNPFADIPDIKSVYYCDAVLWAYENGYVSGYSDPKGVRFGADDEVTRGQVVTFLWRAAGTPKPTSSKNPFVDVKNPSGQYYGTAMLWASENGIVSGYSDPKGARFAPDDSCTRGQVVTFLWRYAQKFPS